MSELEQSQQDMHEACPAAGIESASEVDGKVLTNEFVEQTMVSANPILTSAGCISVSDSSPAPHGGGTKVISPSDTLISETLSENTDRTLVVSVPVSESAELQEYRNSTFSELVDMLREVLSVPMTQESRNRGREINSVFFRKLRTFKQTLPPSEEPEGEKAEPVIPELPVFEELYGMFKRKVGEYAQEQEAIRTANLARRREIVQRIAQLTEQDELTEESYREFKQLTQAWKGVGHVPQAEAEGVLQSYHHQVELFYQHVKINRELRDLHFKRNLDEKTHLCEQAEDLIAQNDIVQAFKDLQVLHAKWKEVGPVAVDKSEDLWTRFSTASAMVNARHREYNQLLKAMYETNLARKGELCNEVEAILALERKTPSDWARDAKLVMGIQQKWRTIGTAGRKQNDRVWSRFQELCTQFFTARREYDKLLREEGRDNLQLKLDLCLQAEALKDSTDWRAVSPEMIDLQAKWKSIGYTPYKKGNDLWLRFQAAQNHFFEQRKLASAQQRTEQSENLKQKLALLKELEEYLIGDNAKEAVEWLKNIQSRWGSIGYVPLKRKEELQNRYRELLDKHYSALRLEMKDQRLEEFKQSLEDMQGDTTDLLLLQRERGRLQQRVRALHSERSQMETNMAFFTSSKGNNPVLEQLQAKLNGLQSEIETIREKIKHIDHVVRSAAKE